MTKTRMVIPLLCSLLVLAVPGFGQTVTDCREYLGGIRCESTNNRIQIPDFARDNRDYARERLEGLRNAMETRARIDQMRSQILLNNAIRDRLRSDVATAPQIHTRVLDSQKSLTVADIMALYDGRATVSVSPESEKAAQRVVSGQTTIGEEAGAILKQFQSQEAPPKQIDFLEVLDYAKQAVARYKAGDLSAEMMKSLVNLKANEWVASLQNRGLRPIQIDQLIAQGKADLKALQPPETIKPVK